MLQSVSQSLDQHQYNLPQSDHLISIIIQWLPYKTTKIKFTSLLDVMIVVVTLSIPHGCSETSYIAHS